MAWLSGWSYRRAVTITEQSGSTLTDYQVRIDLNSSNFDFAKANADGSDIRFTADDGETLLPYWIEKWDSTSEEAVIWVKVPSLPANGQVTIYIYYGNSEAVSESDGEAVFEFFDDFEGSSLDTSKWTIAGTYEILEVANGALHLRTTDFAGVVTKQEFSNQYVVEDKSKLISREKQTQVLYVDPYNRYVTTITMIDGWKEKIMSLVGGTTGLVEERTAQLSFDVYYIAKSAFDSGAIEYDLYDEDYNILVSLSGSDSTYTSGKIGLGTFGKSTEPAEFYTDWVRVRKYAEQEPTVTVGSEGLPIIGTVKLSDGTPVQGATVISIREDTFEIVDVTTSESDGSYTLSAAGGVNNTVIVIPSAEDQNGDIKCHIQPA